MSEFETEVKEDVLMIGNISLEEIQAEEQRLREEHVKYQSQEATLHARYSPPNTALPSPPPPNAIPLPIFKSKA